MTLKELQKQIKKLVSTQYTDDEVSRFIDRAQKAAIRDGDALMRIFEALYGKGRKRKRSVGKGIDGKK